jgi:hypothetical protein
MWGTLEPTGSRNSSNARALIVPDSGDLGRLFEPVEGQASRGPSEPALEALISKVVWGGD